MADTWESRDLPVLKAAVELHEETGRRQRASAIEKATGFDRETVQRALRALYREPYFEEATDSGGGIFLVGAPTGEALRIAGQWPSPTVQLQRLIEAFEAVTADDLRPEEERSKAGKIGLWLAGAFQQVALGALSGAGGNLMTGNWRPSALLVGVEQWMLLAITHANGGPTRARPASCPAKCEDRTSQRSVRATCSYCCLIAA